MGTITQGVTPRTIGLPAQDCIEGSHGKGQVRRATDPILASGLLSSLASVLMVSCFLFGLTQPVRAQSEGDLVRIHDRLTLSDLNALLAIIDASGTVGQTRAGTPAIQLSSRDGDIVTLALRQCMLPEGPDGTPVPPSEVPLNLISCEHLELYASFDDRFPDRPLDALNDFNRRAAGVKAFSLGERIVLTRYITLNHGMARGNILGNMLGFVRSTQSFRAYMSEPPEPRKPAPPAGPRGALTVSNPGSTPSAQSAREDEPQELSEAYDFIAVTSDEAGAGNGASSQFDPSQSDSPSSVPPATPPQPAPQRPPEPPAPVPAPVPAPPENDQEDGPGAGDREDEPEQDDTIGEVQGPPRPQ